MPWHLKSEGGQVLVVRNRDKKVVGRHANRKKATAQLKVLYSLEKSQFWALIEKAQFASRSEAGRYAANERWKGHAKDESRSAKLSTKELLSIVYKAKSMQDALGLIAKELGKDAKPQIGVLSDDEVTHYRGSENPTKDIARILGWQLNEIPFATWGQGLYLTPGEQEASFYGKLTRFKLDSTAKLIVGEEEWSEGDKWVQTKTSEPYTSSKVVDFSKIKYDLSGSDLINLHWASQGYDGAFIQGDEVVLFNGSKLTIDSRDAGSQAIEKSLFDLLKASFDGDRSAAGRYAANQRWKGHKKEETTGSSAAKDAIVKALPMAMGLKSTPWAAGDSSHFRSLIEEGVSEESAKLATSATVTLGDYGDPVVAAGNCGVAAVDVGSFLIIAGAAKEGEVFIREVGEPSYGGEGGTHFVTHIGPRDSDDAIIVDFTLRQFEPNADFPWVGTVREYREQGYKTEEFVGPEMGSEMDPIDASGNVLYPWLQPGFKEDMTSV